MFFSMSRNLFKLEGNRSISLIEIEKKLDLAIKKHFRLTNYQMLILTWLKGLWTGILLSLVVHYIFSL